MRALSMATALLIFPERVTEAKAGHRGSAELLSSPTVEALQGEP
jgi:hypothetical protein